MNNELSMQDILLIDKPTGITSFDCIRMLRRKLGVKKMGHAPRLKIGHAGTLDPLATGLMIIGIGEGTKKLGNYLKLPKTYEANILLGVRTDTGDVTGKTLEEFSSNDQISKISNEEIKKALEGMVGKLKLPVPAYSAIKRDGEALYKKARRGEVFESPIKTMEVLSAEFLGVTEVPYNYDRTYTVKGGEGKEGGLVIKVRLDVGSGTYIRSLAEEFGRRLARTNLAEQNLHGRAVPATLAGLRRTRIGTFKIEDAQTL